MIRGTHCVLALLLARENFEGEPRRVGDELSLSLGVGGEVQRLSIVGSSDGSLTETLSEFKVSRDDLFVCRGGISFWRLAPAGQPATCRRRRRRRGREWVEEGRETRAHGSLLVGHVG